MFANCGHEQEVIEKINYYWIFLRKSLSTKDKGSFTEILLAELNDLVNSLRDKYQSLYNFRILKSDSSQKGSIAASEGRNCESAPVLVLQISIMFDDFEYWHDVLYIFIGVNNILAFLNLTDTQNFPDFYSEENHPLIYKIIKQIGSIFQNMLNSDFKFEDQDLLVSKGFHGCVLGCGECCDFGKLTLSPLIGGMYCPAVSEAGKLCIFYHLGIPPVDQICGEYICYKTQELFVADKRNIGTILEKFVPEYNRDDIDEFFNSMETYYRTNDIEEVIINMRRYSEIKEYSIVSNELINLIESLDESKVHYDKILMALGYNDLVKTRGFVVDFINAKANLKKDEIKKINDLMKRLERWKLSMETRKNFKKTK